MLIERKFLQTEGWSVKNVILPGSPVILGFAHKSGGGENRGVHRHNPGEHEIFLVLKGSATMKVDGEDISIQAGDLAIMSTEDHGVFDKSPDFEVVLMMIMPPK